MKKKIILSIFIIIFLLISPISIESKELIEKPNTLIDSMSASHIKIEGTGTTFVVMGSFVLGFGRCAYMRINLNENSHIEINKLLDTSNIINLDGSYVINIFGFIGYYKGGEDITLNGFSALITWN